MQRPPCLDTERVGDRAFRDSRAMLGGLGLHRDPAEERIPVEVSIRIAGDDDVGLLASLRRTWNEEKNDFDNGDGARRR